ncbi:hypothetical protein [Pantoea sp. ME81]|uniref:hypothetical protein n=1 Tax=Pantoea sp. ME81 TaxID=2743935 RepID=UPI0015F6237C|nr:hypothetical protein [Pantoea sp. ME81]
MTITMAMVNNVTNEVENIISVENDDLVIDGSSLVSVGDLFCQAGMFFNAIDKIFYYDKDFKKSPTYNDDGTYATS